MHLYICISYSSWPRLRIDKWRPFSYYLYSKTLGSHGWLYSRFRFNVLKNMASPFHLHWCTTKQKGEWSVKSIKKHVIGKRKYIVVVRRCVVLLLKMILNMIACFKVIQHRLHQKIIIWYITLNRNIIQYCVKRCD